MVNGTAIKILAGILGTTTIALSSFIVGDKRGQDAVDELEEKIEGQEALNETRFDSIERMDAITNERYGEILRRLTSIEEKLPQ
jgi:hypothetical protein